MLLLIGEISDQNFGFALMKTRNASCNGDTAVETQTFVTLYDSFDVASSMLTVDGYDQACAGSQGDVIIGDPYSRAVFEVRYRRR